MASRFLSFFQNSIKKYPVLTNTVVYGTLYCAAELSQQCFQKYYLKHNLELDFAAAARIVAVGSCIFAPTLTYWYRFLDSILPATTPKTVAVKVACDQFIMTPILLVIFFVVLSILEGREDIFEELRLKYKKTLILNQFFWIPASTINFFYIQPHMRVVYVASVAFVWINIICFIKREKID